MRRNETTSNADTSSAGAPKNSDSPRPNTTNTAIHRPQFIPVRDSRNRRVPGLYTRNGRFYAQLWVDTGNGKKAPRRMSLFGSDGQPIRTLQAAKEALDSKRHERRENKLPALGRKPLFADYCETYFEKSIVQRKRRGTISNEQQAIARWRDHLGHIRLDHIGTPIIASYVDKRLKGGRFNGRNFEAVGERTADLDLTMLRNVLNAAVDDGHLRELPKMPKMAPPPAPKRPLLSPEGFDRLVRAAQTECKKNGQQVVDYLQFLAFSGSREKEALRIAIPDVELERGRVKIGSDGLAKNWESRTVEFNPKLESLLQDMFARRAPDSSWLFPSPQRGERDDHAKSFRESLNLARKAARLEWVGFHDLRHYFCSMCVMAGIDFMTIAAWLGHKDGGVLVGKVYGHLLDEHRQRAAKRVRFGSS